MMIGFLIAVNCGAAEAKQAWFLGQTSDYYGKMTLVVADGGCKLVSDRLGVTIVSAAPSWHVYILNGKKKQFLELTAEQWQKRVGRRSSAPLQLESFKAIGGGKLAGLQVVKYLAYNPRLKDRARRKEPGRSADVGGPGGKYNMEIWVATGIKPPVKLEQLTEGLTAAAYNLGFVVKIVNFPGTARSLTALETLTAEKKLAAQDEFETPKGYRRATDELSLMMDEEAGHEVDSLLFDDSAHTGGIRPQQLRSRLR